MAEVKNSFTSSKMNQDLDDRLVPSNEYREGRNISVISSENSNTGAIQNITGNALLAILDDSTETPVEVIGYIASSSYSALYVMVTNYTDTSNTNIDIHQASTNNTISKIIKVDFTSSPPEVITLVSGSFLNFSTTRPITGINLIEDLLFWTDNRNQPRKINVETASRDSGYYSNEEKISVAKYAPIFPISFSKTVGGNLVGTMKDVVSQYLPNGEDNPNWANTGGENPVGNYAGDSTYLTDKFIRFSYRFRFDDGEYSILAPFSQIAFIPQQDGSFMVGDEDAAYRSSIVEFMKNKVNEIELIIPFETTTSNLKSLYNIEEIDIIYKESDSLAVYILDTVSTAPMTSQDTYYSYDYQSRKPKGTLANSQVLRVYDKTPVKALAQETSGGRIIYGNYVDRHTPPKLLDYKVGISLKSVNMGVELPLHTVKQNRNYQIGIILMDKFGRQSDVILSPSIINNGTSSDGIFFVGSSFYVPYLPADSNVLDFFGNSIKILFESPISSVRDPLNDLGIPATGEPGLYSITNPTGWYSYKIVVKQNQQEYYNVYTPGSLAGYPTGDAFPIGEQSDTSHIALFSDNINKVPRDLSEVGPDQKQYRSSVRLFGRVENTATSNLQFVPTSNGFSVPTLANATDLGFSSTGDDFYQLNTNPIISRISTEGIQFGVGESTMAPFLAVLETAPIVSNLDIYWETSSAGLISELNTAIGIDYPGAYAFENVNYEHSENQDRSATGTQTGYTDSKWVTDPFYPIKFNGDRLETADIVSLTVLDGSGSEVIDRFGYDQISSPSGVTFRVRITDNFYFNANSNATLNSFTFKFLVNDGFENYTTLSFAGSIENASPIINDPELNPIYSGVQAPYNICTFNGVNGSFGGVPATGPPYTSTKTSNLTWSFQNNSNTISYGSGTTAFSLTINPVSGLLQLASGNPTFSVTPVIKVRDSGGAIDTYELPLGFGIGEFDPDEFTTEFNL